MMASEKGHVGVVHLLLKYQAQIDHRASVRMTQILYHGVFMGAVYRMDTQL